MKKITKVSKLSKLVGIGTIALLAWFTPYVIAHAESADSGADKNPGDNTTLVDEQHQQSLVAQLVAEAKVLEIKQASEAVEMLKSRENEALGVSSGAEMALFYYALAELSGTLGNARELRLFAEKGLQGYDDETDAVVAQLYYQLGYSYEMGADYESAEGYYQKGLKIAQTSQDPIVIARGQLYVAAIYSAKGEYGQALIKMKNAYAITQQTSDRELAWEALNELGILYDNIGDHEQSLTFHLQAVTIAESLNMRELAINSMYNVASVYLRLKDADKANEFFTKMEQSGRESTERSNLYLAYKGFAAASQLQKKNERALSYINKAEEYLDSIDDLLFKVDHFLLKADIYGELDQTTSAMQQVAIAEKLLPKDQLNNSTRFGLAILRFKARYQADIGQYKQAYELLKEYSDGYKERRNTERDNSVGKLQVVFDVERNEIRNQILEKENQIKALELQRVESEQQIQRMLLIALALMSLGLLFMMYRQFHTRKQLKISAEMDSLTELFNRRYVLAKGAELLAEQGEQGLLSVMVFDLDSFKTINDAYGHEAGDEVLRNVSELSRSCLRETDIMARMGGEEFMAVLPGASIETAKQIADRLKLKVAGQRQQFEHHQFHLTASFGIAVAKGSEDFESLVKRADQALYKAKENGRNCVETA